jgi:hypothetical protein
VVSVHSTWHTHPFKLVLLHQVAGMPVQCRASRRCHKHQLECICTMFGAHLVGSRQHNQPGMSGDPTRGTLHTVWYICLMWSRCVAHRCPPSCCRATWCPWTSHRQPWT